MWLYQKSNFNDTYKNIYECNFRNAFTIEKTKYQENVM